MKFLVQLTVVVAGLALSLESSAVGQTVRPVIVEYQSTAKGKFELVNDRSDAAERGARAEEFYDYR
jgi:hypothetical protein